jgi:hypothetical protein
MRSIDQSRLVATGDQDAKYVNRHGVLTFLGTDFSLFAAAPFIFLTVSVNRVISSFRSCFLEQTVDMDIENHAH